MPLSFLPPYRTSLHVPAVIPSLLGARRTPVPEFDSLHSGPRSPSNGSHQHRHAKRFWHTDAILAGERSDSAADDEEGILAGNCGGIAVVYPRFDGRADSESVFVGFAFCVG